MPSYPTGYQPPTQVGIAVGMHGHGSHSEHLEVVSVAVQCTVVTIMGGYFQGVKYSLMMTNRELAGENICGSCSMV